MKVCVQFLCSACGAEGEGFRHDSEIQTEECWKCGRATYEPCENRKPVKSKQKPRENNAARRASYRFGLAWILVNDDSSFLDYRAEEPDGAMSVTASLLADMFGHDDSKVRDDLLRMRARGIVAARALLEKL